MAPTTLPMVRVDSIRMAVRMVAIGEVDRLVATMEDVDSMGHLAVFHQVQDLFRPLLQLHQEFPLI